MSSTVLFSFSSFTRPYRLPCIARVVEPSVGGQPLASAAHLPPPSPPRTTAARPRRCPLPELALSGAPPTTTGVPIARKEGPLQRRRGGDGCSSFASAGGRPRLPYGLPPPLARIRVRVYLHRHSPTANSLSPVLCLHSPTASSPVLCSHSFTRAQQQPTEGTAHPAYRRNIPLRG